MSFKFTLGVILGVAAGAAIMHYLDTEEGKAFVRKIKSDLSDLEDNLTDLKEDIAGKARSTFGDTGEPPFDAIL